MSTPSAAAVRFLERLQSVAYVEADRRLREEEIPPFFDEILDTVELDMLANNFGWDEKETEEFREMRDDRLAEAASRAPTIYEDSWNYLRLTRIADALSQVDRTQEIPAPLLGTLPLGHLGARTHAVRDAPEAVIVVHEGAMGSRGWSRAPWRRRSR